MHELKLVKELVEKALNIVKERQAKRVKKIFVKIGANSHLTPESFSHLFKEFSKATILAPAEIVISQTQEEGLILESLELEI
jgi:Zn finger protein HypA/HybF involved in hydrogenase expression